METTYRYMCDECGTVFPYDFADRDQAWTELRQNGWIQLPNGEENRDLCNECAPKENGVRV